MNVSEMRNMENEDLASNILKNHAQLFKLRFHSDEAENQRKGDVRKLKTGIARMKTVMRERELAAAKSEQESNNG